MTEPADALPAIVWAWSRTMQARFAGDRRALRVLDEAFDVRTETVRRWCQAGKIAHSRSPGGDYLIARSVVQQFLPAEAPGQLESDRQRTKRVAAAKAAIKNL